MNGISHPYHLDESTSIFRGIKSSIFSFGSFCGVTSGAILFAMSNKKEARLIWVKKPILSLCQ